MFYNILHLPTSKYIEFRVSSEARYTPRYNALDNTMDIAYCSSKFTTMTASTSCGEGIASIHYVEVVTAYLGDLRLCSFGDNDVLVYVLCQSEQQCSYVIDLLVSRCPMFSSRDEFLIVHP